MPITHYPCYEPGVTSQKTAESVPGWHPASAAQCYARRQDDTAGTFESIRRVMVMIPTGEWLAFDVTAEPTVIYDATEVELPSESTSKSDHKPTGDRR